MLESQQQACLVGKNLFKLLWVFLSHLHFTFQIVDSLFTLFWLLIIARIVIWVKNCASFQPVNKKGGPVKSNASKKGDGAGQLKALKPVETEDVEVNWQYVSVCLMFMLPHVYLWYMWYLLCIYNILLPNFCSQLI